MAWTEGYLSHHALLGRDLLAELRRQFPHILQVNFVHDVTSPNLMVCIEERDYGVWEWNEEIIARPTCGACCGRGLVDRTKDCEVYDDEVECGVCGGTGLTAEGEDK